VAGARGERAEGELVPSYKITYKDNRADILEADRYRGSGYWWVFDHGAEVVLQANSRASAWYGPIETIPTVHGQHHDDQLRARPQACSYRLGTIQ
jgi:hypothetical protein